ncbi:DEAD/DEAH box helicase, partial [bacterium]|nr:DEAD/DEAH box helicase [bacterium]
MIIETLALYGRLIPTWELRSNLAPGRYPLTQSELNKILKPWLDSAMGRQSDAYLVWDQSKLHQVMLTIPEARIRQAYPKYGNHEKTLRLASYANDAEVVSRLPPIGFGDFLFPQFPMDWFADRKPTIQLQILRELAPKIWSNGLMNPIFQKCIESLTDPLARHLQVELALLQGKGSTVDLLLAHYPDLTKDGYAATWLFLQGQPEQAHQAFLKAMGKRKSQAPAFRGMAGLFGRLAAIHCNDVTAMESPRYMSVDYPEPCELLSHLAEKVSRGQSSSLPRTLKSLQDAPSSGLDWCLLWSLRQALGVSLEPRPEGRRQLEQAGLTMLAQQLSDRVPFCWGQGLGQREPWRVWLDGFSQGAQYSEAPKKAGSAKGTRLIWNIEGQHHVQPYKQPLKDSSFSGTSVTLSGLVNKPPDYLSEHDRVVLGKVRRERHHDGICLSFDAKTMRALVDHPHLYYQGKPCQLRELPQTLHLNRTSKGYRLTLEPDLSGFDFKLVPLQDGEVALYLHSPHHARLAPLLDSAQIIPLGAEPELREALTPWLGKINLSYAKGTPPLTETVRQDFPLLCLLEPDRQGLRLSWGIQPLGPEGPTLAALQGSQAESLRWQGKLYQIQRDLAHERSQLAHHCQRCPALGDGLMGLISDREEALDLLEQLRSSDIPMHWPQGKSWKLSAPVGTRQVSLQAQADHEWFSLQGEVRIAEGQVVELGRMLELLRQHPGRYVPLDEHHFMHVTQEVRQQLGALDELAETHRKTLRISPLAIPTLAELEFTQLEVDASFQATLERFAAASSYRAQLPKAIQAELRDYQLDGFRWLAQRARAGCGACLADDMGLGKTLQALALMVKEQRAGAHLVVCPTSVTSNWKEQIERFTPSLQALLYEGKERAELLSQLQPGQVIICSYRMLLQDQDKICHPQWNLALLDEAQYIKNPEAKTSRACFSLKAEMRVTTSGTPIENRLSELWSIFRFLNPGLLGSLASFRKRFEQPISEGSSQSRRRLRRLISPFLLRRTKAQVLSELPPRTELTLEIDLSPEERALYESLRRKAEDSLSDESGRFELLAHLTRMRQACCHPGLLAPELQLTSSKLEAFLELLDELRQGNHRALVFSQFTSLLDLLEVELQQRQLEFFRLDGSTPVAERRRQVDAFQSGQGDLFLISLKAGGTGLNLTGADYVVHLDPWWNPAAEDQASDRTHRIGQTRPVTIYRLIARHTIEEKVIQLHGQKR